jgi:hypothetical protein
VLRAVAMERQAQLERLYSDARRDESEAERHADGQNKPHMDS